MLCNDKTMMQSRYWKFLFIGIMMHSYILHTILLSMDAEEEQALLANQPLRFYSKHHDATYDPLKPSYLNEIPIEVVHYIFQFCNPSDKGLNYLIHCFDPPEQIMAKIVYAKIDHEFEKFVLKCANLKGKGSKEEVRVMRRQMRTQMFEDIMKFHQCTKLHQKCQNILKPLLDFEKALPDYEYNIDALKLGIQTFLKEVKTNAALFHKAHAGNSKYRDDELFLDSGVNNYLRFHQSYLQHCSRFLKNKALTVEKPPYWDCYISAQSLAAIACFFGSIFTIFIAAHLEGAYQVPLLFVSCGGATGGTLWIWKSTKLCNVTSIPGYFEKKNHYKKVNEVFKNGYKDLVVEPQELRELLKDEHGNNV